jgi:hypothetical protein
MTEVIGVIFPVPQEFVDRLLVEKRDVFVKYLPHITSIKIKRRQKLLFYASHGTKQIMGESVIEAIEFLTANEVLERYGQRVFLEEGELTNYTLRQPNRDCSRKMLVLVLSGFRKYSQPKKFMRPITMAGQYLTRKEYQQLMT